MEYHRGLLPSCSFQGKLVLVRKQEKQMEVTIMSALSEERIYTYADIEALPEGQRAELIDGKIFMMSPPKRLHQRLSARIHQALLNHIDEANIPCEAEMPQAFLHPFLH